VISATTSSLTRKDVELQRSELSVARAAKVAGLGRHPVGTRRHQTPVAVPVVAEGPMEELLDRLEPVEDHGVRRHGALMFSDAMVRAAAASHRLWALVNRSMRKRQAQNSEPPSKVSRAHARSIVSCTASSASSNEASIR
jgi:hypothetical protein